MIREKKVELLAPGGSVDAVKAAVLAGADAVYCGLPSLNARKRADNLTPEDLAELTAIAHQHQCKIYLTLNIQLLDRELEDAVRMVDNACRRGIDAVIVADWGMLMLVRERFPLLEVHASTQLTTHNAGQIAFLGAAGVSQVNLCRELSLAEVNELCGHCAQRGMTAEVFVHGAWCVSFSGQCFMSSAACGRSGNRGDCSQPCRRSYSFAGMRGGGMRPLFNLKDNSAFARASALVKAGVGAFKIEGRMKSYRYVHSAVSAWRRQIDRVYSGESLPAEDPALDAVFNRSFSSGYLDGRISKDMFTAESGDQSLVELGVVHSYTADTSIVRFRREVEVVPGTPVRVYTAGFTFVCTAMLDRQIGRFEYRLRITHKLKGKIQRGDVVYRQAGEEGPSDLREQIDGLTVRKRPLHITVSGGAGTPLTAILSSDDHSATVVSEVLLGIATSRELTEEIIAEKMGMLGDTAFELAGIDCSQLGKGLFLPISALNDVRRRGTALLSGRRHDAGAPDAPITVSFEKPSPSGIAPSLAVLINDEADLSLAYAPATKLLFELPVNVGDRAAHYADLFKRNPSLIPWFPAILIGNHYDAAVELLKMVGPRQIISDNSGIGKAAADRGTGWIAGPMLGCASSMSLRALVKYGGCNGAFISNELGRAQLASVVAPAKCSRWFTVYAPMLLMNTRQCIARNSSDCGKEFFDDQCIASCGKVVELHDDKRQPMYIVKRPGCYTQVYGGRHCFNPEIIDVVDHDNAVYMIDMRSIPSKSVLSVARQDFINRMEQATCGEAPAGQLRTLADATTAGNYLRGW